MSLRNNLWAYLDNLFSSIIFLGFLLVTTMSLFLLLINPLVLYLEDLEASKDGLTEMFLLILVSRALVSLGLTTESKKGLIVASATVIGELYSLMLLYNIFLESLLIIVPFFCNSIQIIMLIEVINRFDSKLCGSLILIFPSLLLTYGTLLLAIFSIKLYLWLMSLNNGTQTFLATSFTRRKGCLPE